MVVTASWLILGILAIVALVPQNCYCIELFYAFHSPLRRSTGPSPDPVQNGNCNSFNPSSKTATTALARHNTVPLASSSSISPSRTPPSPWSPGRWKITLDFGNEGLGLSERKDLLGWGSDNGRLVLSFEVVANAEINEEDDNSVQIQRVWLQGTPAGSIEPVGDCASYVNEKGQQYVKMSTGQWRIAPPTPLPSCESVLPGQASTLRFSLTLFTAIERNAIKFPTDQILLLQSTAFRAQQYLSGINTVSPYQYAKDRSQKQLEEQLNHETGDRRLDGNDVLGTLGGYKDVAELVMERDKRRRKWKDIEGALPKLDSSIGAGQRVEAKKLLEDEKRWGIWPGDTELLTIERGIISAVAARKTKQRTGFFSWMRDSGGLEEIVVVGKWSASPVFGDDIKE